MTFQPPSLEMCYHPGIWGLEYFFCALHTTTPPFLGPTTRPYYNTNPDSKVAGAAVMLEICLEMEGVILHEITAMPSSSSSAGIDLTNEEPSSQLRRTKLET